MLICIPDVLSRDEVADFRRIMAAESWEDGRSTAGAQSAEVKQNDQLAPDSSVARALGHRVIKALAANLLFVSAAIPLRIFPPLFNRYRPGKFFGEHVDNCIRGDALTGMRMRTDLSGTLFLSEPDDYDGGELVIGGPVDARRIRLPAGHLVLYPSTSLHSVTPVTRGERLASFFWVQSMIGDAHARRMTFELDHAIQRLVERLGRNDDEVRTLTNVYHNLIRHWAQV